MSVRWFIDRDPDGSVSHIIRISESPTELRGEYLRDGRWYEDGSVLDVLVDRSRGSEVAAEEGASLAREYGAPIEVPMVDDTDITNGFAQYFEFAGLRLPMPFPVVWLLEQGDWTVRYRFADNPPHLDFLAIHRSDPPIHGAVAANGTVNLFDTYLDHSVFDPSVDQDEQAAEARMSDPVVPELPDPAQP